MGNIIGYYSNSNVVCFAIDSDGNKRALVVGDEIYEGETIVDELGVEQSQFLVSKEEMDTIEEDKQKAENDVSSDADSSNNDTSNTQASTSSDNSTSTTGSSAETSVDATTKDGESFDTDSSNTNDSSTTGSTGSTTTSDTTPTSTSGTSTSKSEPAAAPVAKSSAPRSTTDDSNQQDTSSSNTREGYRDDLILNGNQVSILSEEGLENGIKDDDSSNTIVNGSFTLSDEVTSIQLQVPTGTYSSGGNTIDWNLSADGYSIVGSTSEGTVIEMNLNVTGNYTATIFKPIDHSDASSEDQVTINFNVRVDDEFGVKQIVTLGIVVEDDSPDMPSFSEIELDVFVDANDEFAEAEGSFAYDYDEKQIINYGADGGHISSIEIAGNLVEYDSTNTVQTIEGENGSFKVDFNTGDYTFKAFSGSTEEEMLENININIVDNDGDIASSELEMYIYVNHDAPENVLVNLDATSTLTEDGGEIVYTATLDKQSNQDTTITLSNGQTITIANGETVGSVVLNVSESEYEDVYVDSSVLTTTIASASNEYQNVTIDDKPAVTTITDTIDDTTVSLDATSTITEAGADVTYTATLTNASDGDTTVTLANGQTITIANGETSGSVVTAVASDEDVYLDESTIQTSITTAVGGNFENLVVDDKPAVTTITDTIDDTTVSLDATSTITEAGADVTYTATLTNASDGDTTVTLANGQTITIANGETSGSVVTAVASDEDVYLDESTIQTSITTAVGGNFENLVVDDKPAVTTITDTIDDTTVSLDATSTITEAGADVTYTATLTNASDGDTTVTLANGQTITIANGETSGSVVTAVASDEDVYLDESTIQTNITTAVGGNFENLVVDDKPAVTTITDTIDDTTVSLDATSTITEAGADVTYTATLTNASDGDTTVTLANGQTITIANGETSGSVVTAVASDEDVYLDESTIQTSITTAVGGNFENLVVDDKPAVTTITDTIDDTTVSLDATSTITEAGADVTYTATLTNASDGDTTVTLANGQTITIANGETSGSVVTAVASDEDVYLDESTIQTSITTAVGGNFENLVVDDKPAVTTITDTIDDTTVSWMLQVQSQKQEQM